MDRKTVPARVYDNKSFSKDYYYPVPERLDNIQLLALPWDQIESTMVNTLMDSSHHQSATVTPLSLPSISTSHHKNVISNFNDSQKPTVSGSNSKRENEDEDDSVQLLDDGHENKESSPPVKKPKPVLSCRAKPGCTYRTTDSSHRHIHERVHLGIKPYLCGLRYCQFSSAYRAHTVQHIKRTHFGSSGVMARVASKPVDYLLVDHSLLLKHELIERTFSIQ